jgi:hypothetical protein
MWKVTIGCDLVRSTFRIDYEACPIYEVYYVLAKQNEKVYIHYYSFVDDREAAEKLVKRIKEREGFNPENSKFWRIVVDKKPYRNTGRKKKFAVIGDFLNLKWSKNGTH